MQAKSISPFGLCQYVNELSLFLSTAHFNNAKVRNNIIKYK